MSEKKDNNKSFNLIADEVEQAIKKNSNKVEKLVRNGLETLEDILSSLLSTRPKEIEPKKINKNDSEDDS